MMSGSFGYFFDVDGRLVPVWEHATHVRSHPEELGLSPCAVEGLDPRRDRKRLVLMALGVGWVRFRSFGDRVSIEFTQPWERVLSTLVCIEDILGLGKFATLTANHLTELRGIRNSYSTIRRAVQEEGIEDLLLRAYRIRITEGD